MRVSIAWWDLTNSEQTVDSLRDYLRDEGVEPWASVPGLRVKFWMADRDANRWGAVTVWETPPAPGQPLPPHRALELIGYPATEQISFEVEATVEGLFTEPALSGLGPALSGLGPALAALPQEAK